MRTFSKKKKLPRLLTLCGAVAVSALLGGCGQSGVPAESFDRSDYYTRGIGSYPGDPGRISLLHYVRIIPRIVT